MNTDFRLKVGIFRHPKIVKLRRRLGYEGAWSFLVLLEFTTVNHADGRFPGMSAEDIGIAAEYDGDGTEFVDTLKDLRLMDVAEDGVLCLHDWAEHNPYAASAPKRSEQAKRAVQTRWEKERNAGGNGNVVPKATNGIQTAYCENTDSIRNGDLSNTPSPLPLPTSNPPTPQGGALAPLDGELQDPFEPTPPVGRRRDRPARETREQKIARLTAGEDRAHWLEEAEERAEEKDDPKAYVLWLLGFWDENPSEAPPAPKPWFYWKTSDQAKELFAELPPRLDDKSFTNYWHRYVRTKKAEKAQEGKTAH